VEKEGFAETRSDGANTLRYISPVMPSCWFAARLRFEVTWPGAAAPHAERTYGAGALRTAGLVQ